jgi:hypothetical protein
MLWYAPRMAARGRVLSIAPHHRPDALCQEQSIPTDNRKLRRESKAAVRSIPAYGRNVPFSVIACITMVRAPPRRRPMEHAQVLDDVSGLKRIR